MRVLHHSAASVLRRCSDLSGMRGNRHAEPFTVRAMNALYALADI